MRGTFSSPLLELQNLINKLRKLCIRQSRAMNLLAVSMRSAAIT